MHRGRKQTVAILAEYWRKETAVEDAARKAGCSVREAELIYEHVAVTESVAGGPTVGGLAGSERAPGPGDDG